MARSVLIKSGVDDVKVDRLAKRMKVTRGSFYWHFQNRQALLDALLHDWKERNGQEIEEIKTRWRNSEPDFAEVIRIWLAEDPSFPQFDIAIRSWGRKAPKVLKVVQQIDVAWIALLQSLFESHGLDPDESHVRARVIYYHQVGYYALAVSESLQERTRLAPLYYQVLTGAKATPALEDLLRSMANGKPKAPPSTKRPPKSALA